MRKGSKHKINYRGTSEERFWAKVSKTDDCWYWLGATKEKGYGVLRVNGHNIGAHVFSYRLNVGEVKEGTFVCHSCDIPNCVNPEHLWLGNNDLNVQDMVSKKRHTLGEKNAQAVLSEKQVLAIRELHKKGNYSQNHIAKMFNVTPGSISMIVNRHIWKHI